VSVPLCKDCRFCTGASMRSRLPARCWSPKNGQDLVHGGSIGIDPFRARQPGQGFGEGVFEACGPKGLWFEPKPVVVFRDEAARPWWRFW
jgi:hypothetical protein